MKYGKKGMAAGGITNMGPTNMSIKGFGMSNKPKPRTGEMQVVREAERAQKEAAREAEKAQRKAARDAERTQRKAATKAKVEQLTAKSINRRADMAKSGPAPKPTPLPVAAPKAQPNNTRAKGPSQETIATRNKALGTVIPKMLLGFAKGGAVMKKPAPKGKK